MTDTLKKRSGEAVLFDLDCTLMLAPDETILGTPVMSYLPTGMTGTAALTFGSPLVNSSAVTYPDGLTATLGKVIQVRTSGGQPVTLTSPRVYTVLATFSTSRGDTRVARGLLQVLSN